MPHRLAFSLNVVFPFFSWCLSQEHFFSEWCMPSFYLAFSQISPRSPSATILLAIINPILFSLLHWYLVNVLYITCIFGFLEKEMAAHSGILWTEEPGGLLSMGLHRVGHDWSDLACTHALEKEMATHSRILTWRIPGTEEPGGLPSMGSHRVGHDWSDLAAATAFGFHLFLSARTWAPL